MIKIIVKKTKCQSRLALKWLYGAKKYVLCMIKIK